MLGYEQRDYKEMYGDKPFIKIRYQENQALSLVYKNMTKDNLDTNITNILVSKSKIKKHSIGCDELLELVNKKFEDLNIKVVGTCEGEDSNEY